MAGLIKVNENVSWSVAGWVFRNVIDDILPDVPAESCPHLLSEIEQGHGEGKLEYVDLTLAPFAERLIMLECLRKALNRRETEGGDAWGDPSFYPGYIARFKELIALIAADLTKPVPLPN